MFTRQEKAQVVLWLYKFDSYERMAVAFRETYEKDAPLPGSAYRWKNKFIETGSVNDKPRSGLMCAGQQMEATLKFMSQEASKAMWCYFLFAL